MKTITPIKVIALIMRFIVQGVTTYFVNIYKNILFARMCSVLNKWPKDIKLPLVIGAIDKE
jgi:hypothetical protein